MGKLPGEIEEYARAFEDAADRQERESAATALVKLAQANAQLFHSGDNCFATVVVAHHQETHGLRSRGFRGWLTKIFFEQKDRVVSGDALTSAITTLEGFARFQCEERPVFVRVADHEGKIYVDLCSEHWEVVEIAPARWRVMGSKECPVRFRRAHGMLALPVPERGGNMGELRQFLNVAGDEDFFLLAGWLIAALHPRGPYPVLILHGEQGSAKTTAERVLRGLIDPNTACERSEPRDPRDLMIAAKNSWVCAFDNISKLHTWFSDGLCRLSTGGGFSTRALYTDDEEIIFEAKRPVILNGIEELAVRGDLLDRALIVYLPSVPEEKRKKESEFNAAYEAARPRLLGALFDAASGALANVDLLKIEKLPRMADCAAWVTAAEPALGWKRGAFLRAYTVNRRSANELPLETPVADAVRKLLLPWTGTATELLKTLESGTDERARQSKGWPASGRSLSNALRRLAPNLRRVGIHIEFGREASHARRRLISVSAETDENSSSEPSEASEMSAFADVRSDAALKASSDATPLSSGGADASDDVDDKNPELFDGERLEAETLEDEQE